jgi:LmbE family N-acetylglucosaminyl deacetylase
MATDPLTIATSKGTALIVLSPHLDDAVLSCGALLAAAGRRLPVTVLTFFTEAGPPPYTLSARRYLKLAGSTDAYDLYASRRAEDREVLEQMGVSWHHLGLPDGQFRRKRGPAAQDRGQRLSWPDHIYPTYRLHLASGRISRKDAATLHRVTEAIAEAVSTEPALLLAPLGIGGHVDHRLVRTAAERSHSPVIYYSDFPYNLCGAVDGAFARRHALVKATWGHGLKEKAALIRGYRSQFPALFPDGHVPTVPEVYMMPDHLARYPYAEDGISTGGTHEHE